MSAGCGFDYTKDTDGTDSKSDSPEGSTSAVDSTSDAGTATHWDREKDSMTNGTADSSSAAGSDTQTGIADTETQLKNTDDTQSDIHVDSESASEMDIDTDEGNCLFDCRHLNWVHFDGGVFQMGSEDDVNEMPVHPVSVPAFDILETEVTVAQYDDCVQDGGCTPRKDDKACPPNVSGFEHYPANCLSWDMALEFCTWANAELPTEAQWEYAARSGGKDNVWPWGNADATCDRVVSNETEYDCDFNGPQPVCSLAAGKTEQGLCDMSGNVLEWLLDYFYATYDCSVVWASNCPMSGDAKSPVDGSAWDRETTFRSVRGGHYFSNDTELTTTSRAGLWHQYQDNWLGTRCARWTTR